MAAAMTDDCTVEHVRQALEQRKKPGPATASAISTALPQPIRPAKGALAELLTRAVAGEELWEYPPQKGQPRYWTQSPRDLAWQRVEALLVQKDRTAAELKKPLVKDELKGLIESEAFLAEMVATEKLFLLPKPPRTKAAKYSLRPIDFSVYAKHVVGPVDAFIKKLKTLAYKEGLPERAVFELAHAQVGDQIGAPFVISTAKTTTPVSSTELPETILQAMHDINPRVADGDLVLIPELRQRLDFLADDRERFDKTLLEMFRDRQVVLSRQNAGTLPESERAQLVTDHVGNYYNTVALWRD